MTCWFSSETCQSTLIRWRKCSSGSLNTLFSRTVTRKRPLEDYKDYRPIDRPVAPDTERQLSDIKKLEADHHSMGLRQILDDSTDSATSDDDGDTVTPDISC